jgi:hypothetical protein
MRVLTGAAEDLKSVWVLMPCCDAHLDGPKNRDQAVRLFFSGYLALNIKRPRAFENSGTTTLRNRLNATKVEL